AFEARTDLYGSRHAANERLRRRAPDSQLSGMQRRCPRSFNRLGPGGRPPPLLRSRLRPPHRQTDRLRDRRKAAEGFKRFALSAQTIDNRNNPPYLPRTLTLGPVLLPQ